MITSKSRLAGVLRRLRRHLAGGPRIRDGEHMGSESSGPTDPGTSECAVESTGNGGEWVIVSDLLSATGHPELTRALEAYRGDPTDVDSLRTAVRVLNDMSKWNDAQALLQTATEIPELSRLRLSADILEAAHRNDEAVEVRRRICESGPTMRWDRKRLVTSLIRAGALDEAESEMATLRPDDLLDAQVHCANATYRFGDALQIVEQMAKSDPDDNVAKRRYIAQLQRCIRSGDKRAFAKAQQVLADTSLPPDGDLAMLVVMLRVAMSVGSFARAAELAARAPVDCELPPILRYRAFARHQAGDLEGAEEIWDQIRRRETIPAARELRTGELTRLDARAFDVRADEIRLFTVVRNERARLEWFLGYYRGLGVDRFFFVDNDSTDGTREYLLAQPDVHVFHTTTSYAEGKSGMVWVNALVRDFGQVGWVMYVDVDEAFVFDDIERHGLRALTSYMQRKGHEVAAGQMVDMFSTVPAEERPVTDTTDYVDRYREFDYDYQRYPQSECPYFFTSGGVRNIAGFSANCTKTPLVRAGRGIVFLGSSHTVTPASISDVDVALLHYKLTDEFADELEKEQFNHRVSGCQTRYREYEKILDDGQIDFSKVQRSTVAHYESSRSLRSVGLVSPLPGDFP